VTGTGRVRPIPTQTVVRLNSEPLGFNPADTQVVTLSLPHGGYASEAQLSQLADGVSQRLRTLPGLEAAGMSLYLSLTEAGTEPLEGTGKMSSERLPRAVPVTIGPGYLRAIGVATLTGRDVAESDQRNTLPVVLMNEDTIQPDHLAGSPGRCIPTTGSNKRNSTLRTATTRRCFLLYARSLVRH
jgi:hypothetical protein